MASAWSLHKTLACKSGCWYCKHPPERDPKRHPLAVILPDGRRMQFVKVP